MVDAVETIAWANTVPWHGLGDQVSAQSTPAQMCKLSKTDWGVEKRSVYIKNAADVMVPVKGEYALTRDSDDAVLSMVGEVYKPVQNIQAFEFFKKFCAAGKMTMETAGSLWGGRYVWVLAKIGKDFKIAGKDEVRPYLLLMSPHVHGRSLVMQYTPIRVVCWNTLSMALGASLKGDGHGFRMPHSQSFDVQKEQAERVLGLCMTQTDEFKEAATLLAKKKATKEKVEQFFCDVLEFDPKKEKESRKIKTPTLLPKFRAALEHAPGQQLVTAEGTWWGALNAVTYITDHDMGRDRSTSLKNVWIGNYQKVKVRALKLAIEYAK